MEGAEEGFAAGFACCVGVWSFGQDGPPGWVIIALGIATFVAVACAVDGADAEALDGGRMFHAAAGRVKVGFTLPSAVL